MGEPEGRGSAEAVLEERLRLAESLLHAVLEGVVPLQRLLAEVRDVLGPALRDEELSSLRREVRQLREGLASRAIIERAKGMLMQSLGITESQAFDLLNELSQRRHRKLRDVATDVVNGALPPRLAVVPSGGAAPGAAGSQVHAPRESTGAVEHDHAGPRR